MSEPEEIQFGCIGCGRLVPAGSDVCDDCRDRFNGPKSFPIERPRLRLARPLPPLNPYEPPSSPIAAPTTFRIGTGLVFIAVIAVCLGALRANVALGVASIVMLIPAAIRTPLESGRRRLEGRPMGVGEQVATFLATMAATWGVVVSSVVAFFATCFPSGLVSGNIAVGLAVGLMGAIACAIWLTRVFLGIGRERRAREREIRYY